MRRFNKLTDAQEEALVLLAEEASEVVQIVAKILRHGLGSYNPDDRDAGTNLRQLMKELGDMQAAQWICTANGVALDTTRQTRFARKKLARVMKYLHPRRCPHDPQTRQRSRIHQRHRAHLPRLQASVQLQGQEDVTNA